MLLDSDVADMGNFSIVHMTRTQPNFGLQPGVRLGIAPIRSGIQLSAALPIIQDRSSPTTKRDRLLV